MLERLAGRADGLVHAPPLGEMFRFRLSVSPCSLMSRATSRAVVDRADVAATADRAPCPGSTHLPSNELRSGTRRWRPRTAVGRRAEGRRRLLARPNPVSDMFIATEQTRGGRRVNDESAGRRGAPPSSSAGRRGSAGRSSSRWPPRGRPSTCRVEPWRSRAGGGRRDRTGHHRHRRRPLRARVHRRVPRRGRDGRRPGHPGDRARRQHDRRLQHRARDPPGHAQARGLRRGHPRAARALQPPTPPSSCSAAWPCSAPTPDRRRCRPSTAASSASCTA